MNFRGVSARCLLITFASLVLMCRAAHGQVLLQRPTELDRSTVDRVMITLYRHRQHASETSPAQDPNPAEEMEEVAEAAAVSVEVVERLSVAEADWMLRRGYIAETSTDG